MSDVPAVVVTGLGATSPIGGTAPDSWRAALAGTSGVATMTHDWVSQYELPVTFAAEAAVDPGEVLARPETRRMDRAAQLAVAATREAWADAGAPEVDGERIGVAVSTGLGGLWTLMDSWDTLKERGPRRVLPMTVPMLMPNSSAAYVSLDVGAKAGVHTTTSACASGAEAVAYGLEMIRSGRADIVVTGGTEASVHALPIAAFARMQALSTRNDSPETASRPYDTTRDGFVLGEGAGALVLEREDHARARGATIYARVAGAGLSSDAHDIAAPEPTGEGQERAMRSALADAGLTAADVVHANAHATSTPAGDLTEIRAIARVMGEGTVVSATKSMTGHLLGGAGALESVFAVLALRDRTAPPTINLTSPEPDLPLPVATAPTALGAGQIAALNNSFGFGGHNVSLIFTSV
ncbi:beta-ketoacyl-[acyl-carrier-protein] synthase family protein [Serinibacter salmoneus]|uniref:3-oxoacyl-[acyl-carrier-protein] synthase II n=1 Tax=Serinibacter salmoneus TaxID=556530 RepID=A0A2A9CZL6_9MICO|nr:beta-ketoacyl-[acyl-carrier-protein] synthase family protein [Serinibacter salmoneus]PFG19833.1 3-oxoacyl-[acyl-carrier-protein] synthase II [Serinibacter salmoneus]